MTVPPANLAGLRVALDANAAAYRQASQTSSPERCWHFLVLTAANEKQADVYRRELAIRSKGVGSTGPFFPLIQRSIVVADPPGRRAGSGGATLGVLKVLARDHGVDPTDLAKSRILLIHSGGASQRLPAYSPLGKIFAPLPLLRPDGQVSTLFDHLYTTLAGLPERLGPGMLVVAGDVFLLFDHRRVTDIRPGVTALSMLVDAELGRGHGVFVADAKGVITRTLQKAPIETMRQAGALDETGRVQIDTGMIFFDADATGRLSKLAGVTHSKSGAVISPGIHERFPVTLDLYEDIVGAIASDVKPKAFIAAGSEPTMRSLLLKTLSGVVFRMRSVGGEFLHLGTTLQFRDTMLGRNPSPAVSLLQQNVLYRSDWQLHNSCRVYHALLSASDTTQEACRIGRNVLVEQSILHGACRIGDGSVVSQVMARKSPLVLGDNLLFFQVPVAGPGGRLYAQVVCGVSDDFKGRHADGKCVYLNEPIAAFMARHRLDDEDIWPAVAPEARTLWTAKLFPATTDRDEVGVASWLSQPAKASARELARWRKLPRYSMAMLLEHACPVGLTEHREVVSACLQASTALDAISSEADEPPDAAIARYASPVAYDAAQGLLLRYADRTPASPAHALSQARAVWCAAQLAQRSDHPLAMRSWHQGEDMERAAFARVAVASEMGHRGMDQKLPDPVRPRPGFLVEARCPVRLDLAGGWSDTPPYCYEKGGGVVNVAIDLDGRPPIQVSARFTPEKTIVVRSMDLGASARLSSAADFRSTSTDDAFALHRLALTLTGLAPDAGDRGVGSLIRRLGGGLELTTECRVPKGSGLGTSSILSATLLGALHAFAGRKVSLDFLGEQTLLLEQRLSTGGGWQDQIGGLYPALKYSTSTPGLPQRPVVQLINVSEPVLSELESRLVVYFSGQQRLAKSILRRVMGRWLGREPAMIALERELVASAARTAKALRSHNWRSLATEINGYWRTKKDMFPGSTTPTIDIMFVELQPWYMAASMAGAGGGGFAYFLCRSASQARELRGRLEKWSSQPGRLGGVFGATINRRGLTITRKHV